MIPDNLFVPDWLDFQLQDFGDRSAYKQWLCRSYYQSYFMLTHPIGKGRVVSDGEITGMEANMDPDYEPS